MFCKLANKEIYLNLSKANTIKIDKEYSSKNFDIVAVYDNGNVILGNGLNIEEVTTKLTNMMLAFANGQIVYELN